MNRNVHPIQFQMFMGAQELQDTITESGDRGRIGSFPSHYGLSSYESSSPYGSYNDEEETMGDMWNRKLAESKSSDYNVHGSGVHESISKEGFRPGKPIKLHWDEGEDDEPEVKLSDAHHRIAAAADIERTTGRNIWIPVDNQDPYLHHRLKKP